MAAGSVVFLRSSSLVIVVCLLFACSSSSTVGVAGLGGGGGKVGGRMEIKDVKSNKEVQELGRFCVEEFNRNHQKEKGSRSTISFSAVVEAQSQVVSGIKYYLKISASQKGVAKKFDAIVVVKQWLQSKELVTFNPSTN